jgi:hypothetical protein
MSTRRCAKLVKWGLIFVFAARGVIIRLVFCWIEFYELDIRISTIIAIVGPSFLG